MIELNEPRALYALAHGTTARQRTVQRVVGLLRLTREFSASHPLR